MARPTKLRKIEKIPAVPFFVPVEQITEGVPENILLLEELEAIRLKDLEGLEQAECAKRMEVSRPTFQRILLSGRRKMADSLINGKVIHIEGGNYTRNICKVVCDNCHKQWDESVENLMKDASDIHICPTCGSKKVHCMHQCRHRCCRHQMQDGE